MPPLPGVLVPVINHSPSKQSSRSNSSSSTSTKRQYNEPPPCRLSNIAPREAKIVGRVTDYHGARYTLKIGNVEVNDVGIDEILEYVSPMELEEYETKAFEEEREIGRIAEAAAEREELERLERRRVRAKTKGTVAYESVDESIDSEGTLSRDIATGRHGRARPDYKHMFKLPAPGTMTGDMGKGFTASGKPRQRLKRRRRDPDTGELLPRSDDDEEDSAGAVQSSGDDLPADVVLEEPKKRRRRKRDSVTGELLDLPSVSKPEPLLAPEDYMHLDHRKRPRRRRHPITGELMELGWRYDPDAPEEKARAAKAEKTTQPVISPSMDRLTISQGREQTPKRLKLNDGSASSASASDHATQGRKVVPPLVISDSDDMEDEEQAKEALRPFLKPANKSQLGLGRSQMSSPQSKSQSGQPNTMTSILQSVPDSTSEEEEWVIDSIMEHRLSDPKTHSAELGTKPIMLYKVRWEGGEVTWEPAASFPDPTVIGDYERELAWKLKTQQSPKRESKQNASVSSSGSEIQAFEPTDHTLVQSSFTKKEKKDSKGTNKQEEETEGEEGEEENEGEEEEEEEYEVEAIRSHRWSDPCTHPAGVGKDPVMLYSVKWKGYDELGWEPIESFPDQDIVHKYRYRAGLPRLEQRNIDEDEMDES